MIHHLKIWPEYFTALRRGDKTFEVRLNDRGFKAGDILRLFEWDNLKGEYTGQDEERIVMYVMRGGEFGVAEGYVVMSLAERKKP